MMEKQLHLNSRPSALGTLMHGFRTGKHRIKELGKLPQLGAIWNQVTLKSTEIRAFEKICNLKKSETLPPLFPFTLLYPINLRILSQKEAKIPMFKMLTVRNSTLIHRETRIDETLDITSQITGQVFYEKGTEFYMKSILFSNVEVVWENTSSFFIPGRPDKGKTDYSPPKLLPLVDGEIIAEWFQPAENRFRFTRLMGDSNGIHYNSRYAKALGFKRDFSQPIRPASKALDQLPMLPGIGPLQLDLHFKGPAYYNNRLIQKNFSTSSSHRFDLYCGDEERPCITGKLERLGYESHS